MCWSSKGASYQPNKTGQHCFLSSLYRLFEAGNQFPLSLLKPLLDSPESDNHDGDRRLRSSKMRCTGKLQLQDQPNLVLQAHNLPQYSPNPTDLGDCMFRVDPSVTAIRE
ncbi:hypothetical protein V6N12_042893 [Hibiscus sabdariffa]|uniref:Uncharacterized protein n=1 Tax=Hibiscus sabdariffa TaxID=183260 RepID=A0ABR2BG30_9ROSI